MPIYNHAGVYANAAREPLAKLPRGKVVTSIYDLDLNTYCGRIGNLYGRHGLCPPFGLRDAAERWIARGIPLSHCLDVIERYLSRHGRSCPSGSGDRNFAWLNCLIQTRWCEYTVSMPYSATEQTWPDDRIRGRSADEQIFHKGHGTPDTQHNPNPLGARSAVDAPSRAVTRRSASADQVIPSGCHRCRSPGSSQSPGPKKIHLAVAWLLTELAHGERAASAVETKALSAGIAPRTYDRARKRLGVTSRRIGFGRRAKYMIALPAALATPNVASIGRALDEKSNRKKRR